jgi:c-di-AMP phosphodiesterase-like protein
MNHYEQSNKQNINKILYIGIIIASIFLAFTFVLNDIFGFIFIVFTTVIFIFYIKNQFNIRTFLNSNKWF